MKKIVLILLCFITLNNVFASSNNSINDKHVMAAVVSLDTATTSENADKREHFKNNIIKFYGKVPEFKRAFDSAYVVKKRDFEKQGKTVEYERLMEIGRILGIK